MNVLLLSSGRNGSNFILSLLAASQELYPCGEIFKEGATSVELNYFRSKKTRELLDQSQLKQLDEYLETALTLKGKDVLTCITKAAELGLRHKKGIVSKLFVEHIFTLFHPVDHCAELLLHCLSTNAKILLLYRNSLFKLFISSRRAALENNWSGRNYDSDIIGITEDDYLAWRDWYMRTWILALEVIENKIDMAQNPILPIAYEDITAMELGEAVSLISRFVFGSEPTERWLVDVHFEVSSKQSSSQDKPTLPLWAEKYYGDNFESLLLSTKNQLAHLLKAAFT